MGLKFLKICFITFVVGILYTVYISNNKSNISIPDNSLIIGAQLITHERVSSRKLFKQSSSTFSEKNTISIGETSYFYTTDGNSCNRSDFKGEKFSHPISVIDKGKIKACLVNPTFTKQAYNKAGGRNLYSTPHIGPDTVSIFRPLSNRTSIFHRHYFPIHDLLKVMNMDFHTIDDQYISENKNALNICSSLILSGHPEYWSASMLKQIKSFIKSGKDLLNLSGNAGYWLVDYNRKKGTITVDKSATGKSYRLHNNPQELRKLLGGYFLGYPVKRKIKTAEEYKSDYLSLTTNKESVTYKELTTVKVLNEKHPAFKCFTQDEIHNIDIPITVEVDGIASRKIGYKQENVKTSVPTPTIPGALFSTWLIHSKQFIEAVVGVDFKNEYGGRTFQIGSIGWGPRIWRDKDILKVSKSIIADFYNIHYQCD